MKNIILCLLALQTNFFFLNGQSYLPGDFFKGYILTKTDTIHCYVQNRYQFENCRVVKYKFTKEDKALEIKIEDVIELFDNTSIYRKITYKNRDYLLKQLVKGPVSLYEQVITNTSSNGTLSNYSAYYLEKSIQLVKVGWTSYKEDLKSVLTDDPETIKKIDELKFGDLNAFIQALVNNYNNKTKGK